VGRYHGSYPVPLSIQPARPERYATTYINFQPGVATGVLRVEFDGTDSYQWRVSMIVSSSETEHEIIHLAVDSTDGTTHGEVYTFDTKQSVTLVVANVSDFSGDGSFNYSAIVYQPNDFTVELLTDSALFVNEPRSFEVQVTNNGTSSEVFRTVYFDDQLWADSGWSEVWIDAGGSESFFATVTAPEGTALGSSTDITFKVFPADDELDVRETSITAVVSPRRGDVNYDGKTNLADITGLISFVYVDANNRPNPLYTGDFNCDDAFNLGDITKLINKVYLEGTNSPCDPY
jgi:hypothetical protein